MEESQAIARYKRYAARHLPNVETLSGYWVPDFDPVFYQQEYGSTDMIDVLKAYLDQLGPYAKVLVRAAELRQQHYEEFIKGQDHEDLGHRAWRKGLNAVAKDAMQKYTYWHSVWEQKLTDLIESYKPTLSSIKSMAGIRNVDHNNYQVEEKKKNIVRRPRVSKQEKRRRARARKHEQEQEQRRILECAVDEQDRKRLDVFTRCNFLQHNWKLVDHVKRTNPKNWVRQLPNVIQAVRENEKPWPLSVSRLFLRFVCYPCGQDRKVFQRQIIDAILEPFAAVIKKDKTEIQRVEDLVGAILWTFYFFNAGTFTDIHVFTEAYVDLITHNPVLESVKGIDWTISLFLGLFPSPTSIIHSAQRAAKNKLSPKLLDYLLSKIQQQWLSQRYRVLRDYLKLLKMLLKPFRPKDKKILLSEMVIVDQVLYEIPKDAMPKHLKGFTRRELQRIVQKRKEVTKNRAQLRYLYPITKHKFTCAVCGEKAQHMQKPNGEMVCRKHRRRE